MLLGLAIFSAIIAAALVVRLFFLTRAIRRINHELHKLNTGRSKKIITTLSGNKDIEALCESINRNIAFQERKQIQVRNHEQNLRDSIANISHDLRTPLTSIWGYLTMIKANPDKISEYLNNALGKVKHLSLLIEDFFELSVIDGDAYIIKLERVDIVAILTDCVLESYAFCKEKGIHTAVNLPENATFVWGNKAAIERIFQNLLQNAIKFSCGDISIECEDDGRLFVLAISNNTKTLSADDIPHLFDRFYIADKARSKGNTGLGLYIVKVLLDKIQGVVLDISLKDEHFSLKIGFQKIE
jgi:signal transduction histidine kinase